MKIIYLCRSLTIASLMFFLFSCKAFQKMQEDMANSRDKERKAFVEKKDGEIIEANEARLRTPIFGKTAIELDKDVKIPLKEVAAYQNNTAYFLMTPRGFVPRIKKGLIDVYLGSETYTEYETSASGGGGFRTKTRSVYLMQKGKNNEILEITPSLVETYVSDYAPAMEFMHLYNQTRTKTRRWSLINTGAIIGGLVIMGVGSESNVEPAMFGGAGLFLGGIVNGFVNRGRKARNAKNMELAIDAYNFQTNKRKK